MSVSVFYDVAFARALRLAPRALLPEVLAVRDRIVANAPNLPALVDGLVTEALPDVRYARHVPLRPWVVVYSWEVSTQTLVFRAVWALDPPF
ncbi:MAG: hypothetical protein U0324_33345 [Polyangiales bacterium]